MDIKPANMGSVFCCNEERKSLAPEFTASEIVKMKEERMVMTSADVYSWGMSFYTLLLDKGVKQLRKESTRFEYKVFMKRFNKNLEKLEMYEADDIKRKEIVIELLNNTLSYELNEKLCMRDIVSKLRVFGQENSITLDYSQKEEEKQERFIELFSLQLRPRKEEVKILNYKMHIN
jgi:hypothetical protein